MTRLDSIHSYSSYEGWSDPHAADAPDYPDAPVEMHVCDCCGVEFEKSFDGMICDACLEAGEEEEEEHINKAA